MAQAITTLDSCLTRLGRREEADSVRSRAAQAMVYRSSEQQNSAAVPTPPNLCLFVSVSLCLSVALCVSLCLFASLCLSPCLSVLLTDWLEQVVEYPGMRSKPWWTASEISPEMVKTVRRMQNKAAAIAAEARGLLRNHPECWRQNTEGLADGHWTECALIALGVPNATLCASVPVTCRMLSILRDEEHPCVYCSPLFHPFPYTKLSSACGLRTGR